MHIPLLFTSTFTCTWLPQLLRLCWINCTLGMFFIHIIRYAWHPLFVRVCNHLRGNSEIVMELPCSGTSRFPPIGPTWTSPSLSLTLYHRYISLYENTARGLGFAPSSDH